MAQSLFQPLSGLSSTVTANSTSPGINADPGVYPSSGVSSQGPMVNSPAQTPVFANVAPSTVPSVTSQYAPQVGPTTQRVADSNYASAITNAVSSSAPVPSTAITSGNTLAGAGATRNSYESLLQQYLDQQKQYQQQLLSANTAGPTETAASQRLAQLKTQAALNQEQALNSGETSSFAGGEAQRVARTDAIKIAGAAAELQQMQDYRENAVKTIEALMNSGDQSFKTQLEIQKLRNEVSGIDKQSQDTFFNLAQSNPDVAVQYDPTKTATQNLMDMRKAISQKPDQLSLANRQTRINSIVNEFNNEQSVKNYQTVAEGVDFARSLASKLATPGAKLTSAENIGMLYAFAKAMDPGSVVREGEYATVQKYAQSWAESFGLNVQRIFNNQQFLTDEAVKNLSSVMQAKYNSSEKNYQNILNSYNKKIEAAKSGDVGGSITDYSQPFSQKTAQDYSAQDAQMLQTINKSTGKKFTQQEIDAYKQYRGFNTVGSDTNRATDKNLTGDLGNMQGLMGQLPPVDYSSTAFNSMTGLMQLAPALQLSKIEIPKTSALSFANNNPGNLKFAGQDGAVKGKGGFARFNSPEDGVNALMNQIRIDAERGHTLATFINKFAPPTENDTKLYVQQAMKYLGVTKDTPISQIPVDKLTKFIALKESSTKVN